MRGSTKRKSAGDRLEEVLIHNLRKFCARGSGISVDANLSSCMAIPSCTVSTPAIKFDRVEGHSAEGGAAPWQPAGRLGRSPFDRIAGAMLARNGPRSIFERGEG